MPNLRATTSKEVTHAMMTINHPDVRAIHSSGRRKPSDSFNNALILSAPRHRAPPWHNSMPPWPGRPADYVLTEHRAPQSLHPAPDADARRAGSSIGI